MSKHRDHLIWLDMEMSGLDPQTCVPLEIATIVTDSELNVLAEGPNVIVQQPPEVLEAMDAWNTEHHGASGLTEAVLRSKISCARAEEMTLSFLEAWTYPGASPLCGNTIGQDRRFIRRYMPRLDKHLHYRMVDISSIKELVRRWYGVVPPPKEDRHRALYDVEQSIEELRFYRRVIFRKEAQLEVPRR